MMLLSAALAWPLHRASPRAHCVQAFALGGACIASIGLGLVIVNDALGAI